MKYGKGFVEVFRETYPRTLNLGMSGNGPLAELAVLKEYLTGRKTKFIFWVYFEGNDVESTRPQQDPTGDIGRERKSEILLSYLRKGFRQNSAAYVQELRDEMLAYYRNTLVDRFRNRAKDDEEKWKSGRAHSKKVEDAGVWTRLANLAINRLLFVDVANKIAAFIRKLLVYYERNIFQVTPIQQPNDFELFSSVIDEANRFSSQIGARLVFVYLPDRWTFSTGIGMGKHPLKEKVVSMVRDLGVPVIDVTEPFDSHGDPLALFLGHYNDEGYSIVANHIVTAIGRPGFISEDR